MTDPDDAAQRGRLWSTMLERHAAEIDVLIVWGHDAALEAENDRWFRPLPLFEDGPLRAFRRRGG